MSNYVKATNFASKDSLTTGNSSKLVRGTEIDDEFNAIATAIGTKADTNSPTFTGTPAAPTPAANTNTTQLATTAFVNTVFPAQNNSYSGTQTYKDTRLEITNTTDATKKAVFDLASLTTATTRTYTWPDKNGTVAMTSDIVVVPALSSTSNSIVSGSYSASGSSTITLTCTNSFAAGQEVYVSFTNTSGSTLANNKFTVVSATGANFTINYGSTITSAGTFTAERYGIIAVANQAEITAGTSQLKAVTPKLYKDNTIGIGQTWQTVTRALATVYQNTTGKPIMVSVSINGGASSAIAAFQVSTDNITYVTISNLRAQTDQDVNGDSSSFIIPNGHYYKLVATANSPSIVAWAELR